MLPISEKTKSRKRKSEVPRVKLPTQMQSKYQKKCPICNAPMANKCINCGYLNDDNLREALFDKASEIRHDSKEDQYEGNE